MIHKPQLSPARRALVERTTRLRYGCIENILVHQGEPDLSRIQVLRDVKLGRRTSPRTPPGEGKALKGQFSHLWEILDEIGDGRIAMLEVQDGLPYRIGVDESPLYRRVS